MVAQGRGREGRAFHQARQHSEAVALGRCAGAAIDWLTPLDYGCSSDRNTLPPAQTMESAFTSAHVSARPVRSLCSRPLIHVHTSGS